MQYLSVADDKSIQSDALQQEGKSPEEIYVKSMRMHLLSASMGYQKECCTGKLSYGEGDYLYLLWFEYVAFWETRIFS